jgi:lysine N6-hydroxylase
MLLNKESLLDCIGAGIGPSNLSLACLLEPVNNLNCCFFEQNDKFVWHEGLLLQNASIQVSIFKDLVSLIDPTNQNSFTKFLHEKQRFYQFINAGFKTARRSEFNQYFQWVCNRLGNLKFSHKIEQIGFDKEFIVTTNRGEKRAKNLVLGVGQTPFIPEVFKGILSRTIYHAKDHLKSNISFKNKRVAIIGGGQTGAEIFLNLVNKPEEDIPSYCVWVSRRSNYFPLDDSCFTNEFFMPAYSSYFQQLSADTRKRILQEQKLLNNGISSDTIKDIYQAIYDNNFLKKDPITLILKPGRDLTKISSLKNGWQLIINHLDKETQEELKVDIVILATGYSYQKPAFLEPIAHRIEMIDGEPKIKNDFSVYWDGPNKNRIYIQNFSMKQKGIADPNLSLIAWRSAKILNSLAGKAVYMEDYNKSTIKWDIDLL